MSNKLNIEELFKEKFEGYEAKPSGGAYAKIQRAYNRRQFMRFNPRRLNIYYTLGTILVGAAIAYGVFSGEDNMISPLQSNNTPIENETPGPETKNQTATPKEGNRQKTDANAKQQETVDRQLAEKAFSPENDNQESETKIRTGPANEDINLQNEQAAKEHPDLSGPVSTMVAYFIPSTREGCAPLSVEFTNLSTNAASFEWNFGTNLPVSHGNRADVMYTEPGSYTVTLLAIDNNGLTLTHSETITVHSKPKADFEITDDYIYNYSTDATTYKWLLIAQDTFEISSDFQIPLSEVKTYKLPATSYQLSLIATNIHNCSDTISKTLPEPSSPSLAFPTAFSPNPNGPTGGYYSPNDIDNNVFHPVFKEEPLEYSLKIYSKTGELIFESNNIYKGWDGYYKQEVSPKGVYIYQVSGQWKNGNTFNLKGDITVLWNE